MKIKIGVCHHGNRPQWCEYCEQIAGMSQTYKRMYAPPGVVAYRTVDVEPEHIDKGIFKTDRLTEQQVKDLNLKEYD